jgi:hypothetical protein
MHNMNLRDDGRHIVPIPVVGEDGDDDDLRYGIELLRIRGRIDADAEIRLQREAALGVVGLANYFHRIPDYNIDANHFSFRHLLVTHYNYCKEHKLIEWF